MRRGNGTMDLTRTRTSREPEERTLLSEMPLGSDQLRINRAVFNGKPCIDIRRWYMSEQTQDYQPSSKGFNVPENRFDELVDLINEAKTKLDNGEGE